MRDFFVLFVSSLFNLHLRLPHGSVFARIPHNRLVFLLLCLFALGWVPRLAAGDHQPKMSYLENGSIRVGMDLNLGGAITYLAPATNHELNVINSFDWGRQVQLSFYSGPVPFTPAGSRMAKAWEFIGWNPIQSGDCYGHESRVLEQRNDGRELYVKCVPMHWPLDNVPGECFFEVWLRLDGAAVKARCRLTNQRPDLTQYRARNQELPAVYVNGPFYRLFSYTGEKPFTGDTLSRIEKPSSDPAPWAHWVATENWAAHVNDAGWGLGVWNPDAFEFDGGFAGGKPGAGGPKDDPTGYIGPLRIEILDHNIVYEYRYDLILGTLEAIRDYVYAQSKAPRPPVFRFTDDRQGWWYEHATDSGWPIRGQLEVIFAEKPPQLISSMFFTPAEDAPKLRMEAAFDSSQTNSEAAVFWRRLGQKGFVAEQRLGFQIIADGKFHRYDVDLTRSTEYRGVISQLRLDPATVTRPGDHFRLKWVSLTK